MIYRFPINVGDLSGYCGRLPEPEIMEDVEFIDGEACVVCGKPRHCINGRELVYLKPLICSVACLKKELQSAGATFHFDDGSEMKVEPDQFADVEVDLDQGYVVMQEGSPTVQSIVITVDKSDKRE